MRDKPNIFSIPASVPFLPTFVEALLSGKLIEDFAQNDKSQTRLIDSIIYVPTRRAARALRSAFVENNMQHSSFLPTILSFGDREDDIDFFELSGEDHFMFNPKIGDSDRILILARLIRPWRENLPYHIRAMFGSEDVLVPSNTADAIWLAQDLARLMDEVETEAADWSKLHEIHPDMVAEWWQITLEFLNLVTKTWPQILQENHLENPAIWRNKLIARQTEKFLQDNPERPILVAGSNGSIPAIADFLHVVSRLNNGAVVLPGLDHMMDEAQWRSLDGLQKDAALFTHPQYNFKKLLDRLNVVRSDIKEIGHVSDRKKKRAFIVSESLRSADTTDHWIDLQRENFQDISHDISLIEAANEREEALAIAVALRQAIETPKKTAAFITGDRTLARRVVSELARFGIQANDSGGVPLSETLPATLIRLILNGMFEESDPVAYLSLLKHPLTCLGLERSLLRAKAEEFELFALRGGTGRVNLATCETFFEARLLQLTENNHLSDGIDKTMIENARDLTMRIAQSIKPLITLMQKTEPISVSMAAIATVEVFEAFGRDENNSLSVLYQGEAGKAIIAFFRNLIEDHSGLTFDISEWPNIFEALIASRSVSPPVGGHPRLFIWGALESRLQTVDTVVLGGMNEGSWPQATKNDPFMSRTMKMMITLDPPERRIGLAAHDFQMAMGMDKIILSRSVRAGNAPSVPSRWLQRLQTVLGPEISEQMRHQGAIFVHWARELDDTKDVAFVTQPCPAPPLSVRPKHFSVTEIETLRRDPYAIYAKKILRLKPLDPLIHDPSAAERGTLYHAIVAAFIEQKIDPKAPDAHHFFLNLARAEFDRAQLPLDVEAVWWPRFEILVPALLDWEKSRADAQSLVEISARPLEIGKSGVTLSGRADRIDIFSTKNAEILDFKTGSNPSLTQARTLMAPQLALEAALFLRNRFEGCKDLNLVELIYVRLTHQGEVKEDRLCAKSDHTVFSLSEKAWTELDKLMHYYNNDKQGYLSRAMPALTNYKGDYDHLARVLEWSAENDNGGEE
ncbi:double-strand break repair protein AddB [Bartonella tamiae]|uniref:Double-strand break repair protein AddB n=1 Tax=Bartonella tamiae Th239 TaxID=1094558 RepID=J1K0Z9_9HYPH|nr:double-strand break repair protein AddB [Bartonella tamiae]EJF91112.1 double-strand break repair protein AddB [Bartonella tamiae Th239]EJF93223.1 double-strand break repair protein AddB [Bartonella tamiae Th307]